MTQVTEIRERLEERLADIKEQITNGGGSINLNAVKTGASISTIRLLAESGFYVIENDALLALLSAYSDLRGEVGALKEEVDRRFGKIAELESENEALRKVVEPMKEVLELIDMKYVIGPDTAKRVRTLARNALANLPKGGE